MPYFFWAYVRARLLNDVLALFLADETMISGRGGRQQHPDDKPSDSDGAEYVEN